MIVEFGSSVDDRRVLLESPPAGEWLANAVPLLDEKAEEALAGEAAGQGVAQSSHIPTPPSSTWAQQSSRVALPAASTEVIRAMQPLPLREMRVRRVQLDLLPGANLLEKICSLFAALS